MGEIEEGANVAGADEDGRSAVVGRPSRPEALKKEAPLVWSPGRGVDVWAMFEAAITGDVQSLGRLLDADPSLARCHYEYRTPLSFAVRENQVAAAAYLLDRGVRPTFGDPRAVARERGYEEMASMLEDKLAELWGVSPQGEDVAEAIREGDGARLRQMLDDAPALVHAADGRGNRPIHWAVMTRSIETIDELLDRGADIDAQRPDGARPIQLANGDYHFRGWRDVPSEGTPTPREVIDHLRARGAYVDVCTASWIGDEERVRALLGDDPSLANRPSDYITYYACSGTPLRNAAGAGHMAIVRLLLDHGADPNLPEEHIAPRGHALHAAVCGGHHEIVELLLEHGAHPNVEIESSADTLSAALARDDERMVRLLCSWGAARTVPLLAYYDDVRTAAAVFDADPALADDPEALGYAGSEAFVRLMLHHRPGLLRRTTVAKSPAVTRLLFRRGMDPDRADWLGITQLHRLAGQGDVELAAVFLDHGAAIDPIDAEHRSTPLGWAARSGRTRMVELLLGRGADPALPHEPAWARPLAWAERGGHDEIVHLLNELERTGTTPRRTLAHYAAAAEDLFAACESGADDPLERTIRLLDLGSRLEQAGSTPATRALRLRGWVRRRLGPEPSRDEEPGPVTIDEARMVIARSHGYPDWRGLEGDVVG